MYQGFGFSKKWDRVEEGYIYTFAIPTKDWSIQILPLKTIEFYIKRFVEATKAVPDIKYYVTAIGTGLAGYTPEDIAPMFQECVELENVCLPQRFWDVLNKNKN